MTAIVLTDDETLRRIVAEAVANAMAQATPVAAAPVVTADPDALMTREEVATLLKVDARTLRRLEQEPGALPAPVIIAGRLVRWRRVEITAMLDNHGKTPKNPANPRFHSSRRHGSMSPKKGVEPRG